MIDIRLSEGAVAVVAGLVAPSNEVDHTGVFVRDEVWAEIRAAFTIDTFQAWAARTENATDEGYLPAWGWGS